MMQTLEGIEVVISPTDLVAADMRRQFEKTLGINSEDAVLKTKALSPELKEELFNALERRLTNLPKHYTRPSEISWDIVKAALERHPEQLFALARMEATYGEPDVLEIRDGCLIFTDFAEEAPLRGIWRSYDQVKEMAREFGAEIINEADYIKLQELGKFDNNKTCWILSDPNDPLGAVKKAKRGQKGIQIDRCINSKENVGYSHGWRGIVKVPLGEVA